MPHLARPLSGARLLLMALLVTVRMEQFCVFGLCIGAGWLGSQHTLQAAEPSQPGDSASLRYPVAMELLAQDTLLVTANQRGGSLSLVDLRRREVRDELPLGGRPSDLAVAGSWLLVTDEQAHELVLLQLEDTLPVVRQRLPVSPYPVEVVVGPDGSTCYVASLWSRQLTRVRLPEEMGQQARVDGVLDLPFAPRKMLPLADTSQLLVADSFGGRLGLVELDLWRLERVRDFPAHNIRGLARSANGRMLIVTHQMLNSLAHTVRNDVHWGLLMSNDLRWLKLENVLTADEDLYRGAHMHPLGEAGGAAGDPAEVAVAADGTVVVALAGVGQVAVGREEDFSLFRLPVGQRPLAVRISADGRQAFVGNMFSDSISIVDLDRKEVVAEIPLGAQRPLKELEAGERLFFDARLSHDGWMSCHSCHTDGHTNSMLNDNFSDKAFGAPKRVLSLLGRRGTEPFAWNAAAPDLETQIRNSLRQTMQTDEMPAEPQLAALAAYVLSLAPPPPVEQLRSRQDDQQVARGRQVFERLDCAACHAPPAYTTPDTYDVGLEDQHGNRRFNPPSLRGLSQRDAYFHDNRARTLSEVFEKFQHQLEQPLDESQRADLLAFLRSL
ncbi:MAG: c-type cytochrome [Pirellulaceae bacterium]|nr:c-type cytochrome [Pirellulaceae bacterium]